MPIVYLDASAYRCLREEGIEPTGTPIDKTSKEHDDIEVTFDDIALVDLAGAFRFGDVDEGAELLKLVRSVVSERMLKHFGWIIRDEIQALMEMIPRFWWHYDDDEADRIRRVISDLSEGKYEVASELDIRERMSRQEAFGRVLYHMFKESTFDADGFDDFPGFVVRYEKENRREYIRKLVGDVVRAEKPGEIARRVDTKIARCPAVGTFTKIPLLKQHLYKVLYEDRKRSDDDEMLHLCCLAHVDILVSQSEKFKARFLLLYPDKEAYEIQEFLEASKLI